MRDKGRLCDIIEHADKALEIMNGRSFEDFSKDIAVYYAVMKCVEIVGEATYMLTHDFKRLHPEIPWPHIQGLRHVLVHGYAQIVPETLYDTAINDLPVFRKQVARFLEETDWDEWEQTCIK